MSFQQHIFEFSLYNDEVRMLVQNGESHRQLDDDWSEQRYIQIKAESEEKARMKLHRNYPENKGYVCTSVIQFLD